MSKSSDSPIESTKELHESKERKPEQDLVPEKILMRLAMLGGPFKSDEDVEIINWLANRELHHRRVALPRGAEPEPCNSGRVLCEDTSKKTEEAWDTESTEAGNRTDGEGGQAGANTPQNRTNAPSAGRSHEATAGGQATNGHATNATESSGTPTPRNATSTTNSLSPRGPEFEPRRYRDFEPCEHRGCLSHVTHPCDGCGRIAGQYPSLSPRGDDGTAKAELSGVDQEGASASPPLINSKNHRPGREMDALIAERVMGHTIEWVGGVPLLTNRFWKESSGSYCTIAPCYSTEVGAAWEVVEKIGLSVVRSEDGWYAIKPRDIEHLTMTDIHGHSWPSMNLVGELFETRHAYETAPLAICLAALRAVDA